MSEIIEQIEHLDALPSGLHWFCPRTTADDGNTYYDEDVLERLKIETEEEKQQREEHINRVEELKKKRIFHACQILAFDGADATPYQNKLKAKIEVQLTRCSICVRQFHRMRADLQHQLQEDFDDSQVEEFMKRYDGMNIERICTGLDSARDTLLDTPPDERKISSLSPKEMFALFETMHCMPFLQNEELLRNHFDEPFRLVQSKSKISLPEYTPALTAFLFSFNDYRRQWALRGWKKFKRGITGIEFDQTVKDNVKLAAGRVGMAALEKEFLPLFWIAIHTIVDKLDQDIITHHFRAMDVEIYKLLLDHLYVPSEAFGDLIITFQLLLEKSPVDMWNAYGPISPQTVMDQIFNSPNLETLIREDTSRPEVLQAAFDWINPFIKSIKGPNLPPVCRSMLHQMWSRFQSAATPEPVRVACYERGLDALAHVLEVMEEQNSRTNVAAFAGMLGIMRDQIQPLMDHYHSLPKNGSSEQGRCCEIVERTLRIDCIKLRPDREAIVNGRPLGHDQTTQSLEIWKVVVRNVRNGDVQLAAAIINGAKRLLLLEPLAQKQVETAGKPAQLWNEAQASIQSFVVDLLEAMQDFSTADLEKFFSSQDSVNGFMSLLFFDKRDVQQAAAAVIKAVTSESSRRDALRVLIQKYYSQTLQALSNTLISIAKAKVFMPATIILKIGTDFLESLCSTQDGILRSRTLSSDEIRISEQTWKMMWISISTIFDTTEAWSNKGHDKSMMVEFCRDSMDFADQVFDRYSIFASALSTSSKEDKAEVEKSLLEAPAQAAIRIVKWLRLRDDYLIDKAVALASSLMSRLEAAQLALPEDAIDFINSIVTDNVRSKLKSSQKAQLRRALEKHLGELGSEEEDVKVTKQSSLNKWVSGAVPVTSTTTTQKKQGIDMNAWKSAAAQSKSTEETEHRKLIASLTPGLEKFKASGGYQSARPAGLPMPRAAPKLDNNEFKLKRQAEMEARKKQNAAIIAAKRGIGDAGSALAGIGVEGKDYTVKGEGVMVSSDESSDDEGDLDSDLFGDQPKTSKRKTAKMDLSGVVGMKPEQKQGPVRVQRQMRSHKDMRARLQPDLSPLHKTILSWDFFHRGDYPPNSNDWQYSRVSKEFRHVQDYRNTFQPLLQLEAWQSFVSAREESNDNTKSFEIKVGNRSSVDAFVEISTSISHAENREQQVMEGDIILFSTSSKPIKDADAPHCLSRVYKLNRKKGTIEVVYRVMPGNSLNNSLTPNSVIHGTKIQSITSLEREYSALSGLQYYDLCDEIIKARPSPLLNYTDKQLEPLMSNYTVNKAQAKAIKSALDNDAFTLIQGPPGTGKTKTIVAIVGGLLSDSLANQSAATRIDVPKAAGKFQAPSTMSKKLLVCAPSNAAVDELVMRLKEGVKTVKGVHKKINVLRLGRSDKLNSAVIDVTMDELVNKRMGKSEKDNNPREKTQALIQEFQKINAEFNASRDALNKQEEGAKERSKEEMTKLQDEFHHLRRRKNELSIQIDNSKDAENAAGRTADLERRKVQQAVLDDSHVICATLSGSGHEMFQSLNIEFETVVVDEAAQCVEMSALIPLKYGCAKAILVGDPKQLPPTVFSKEAAKFQYEQSLFVRMQGNHPESVHLLDTQYRMHPDISAFPSAQFYDGRLLDGGDMEGLRRQAWHKSSLLAPYRFFDVVGQHQAAVGGRSLVNKAEIQVAMALYDRLTKDYQETDFTGKIGIITPYKAQLNALKDQFSRQYGNTILESVEFNTTDAFQGRESEVIIFSCVRASPAGNIGFLQDIRRMNVGLTRAKSSLWVLGNSESLMRGEYWKRLVLDAQERDVYTKGDVMGMLRKPSSSFPAKPRTAVKKALPSDAASRSASPVVKAEDDSSANGQADRRPSAQTERKVPHKPSPMFGGNNTTTKKIVPPGGAQHKELAKVKQEVKPEVELAEVKSEEAKLPSTNGIYGDAEMKDVDGGYTSSRTTTPQPPQIVDRIKKTEAAHARSSSPASASEKDKKPAAPQRAPQPSGPAPPPRKRKPADPFMPKSKVAKR